MSSRQQTLVEAEQNVVTMGCDQVDVLLSRSVRAINCSGVVLKRCSEVTVDGLPADELVAYAEERERYARVRMTTDLAIDVHTALDKILATGRPLNERDREALQMVLDQARGELRRLIGFVWFTGAGFVFPACPTLVWEGDQA